MDDIPQGVVRKARVTDAAAIQRLVGTFAERDEMLPRSLGEIYENIRDFFVAEDDDGRVVGCGGLHVCWSHLAEIKSLAVAEACQGSGYGRRLVLDQSPDPDEPGSRFFRFVLNHEPIFARGADWIPADSFVGPLTRDRYTSGMWSGPARRSAGCRPGSCRRS